jgi:hypothetical protein
MQCVLNNMAKLPLVVTWLFCLEEGGVLELEANAIFES